MAPKTAPRIDKRLLELVEKLTNASGTSGGENEVRTIILSQIKPHVDHYHIDALGNILAIRKGKGKNVLRIMLSAHMDEVGGMILDAGQDGLYRFELVGKVSIHHLVGKLVEVGKGHLQGVIGCKPIHLLKSNELNQAIPIDSLRIDLGPEGGSKASLGDRFCFSTKFINYGELILAKALDDRLGVAVLIEMIKTKPENIELLAAFTVQEEIGLRGARVAAYALDPQLAIALDATNACEMPDWDDQENIHYNSRIGHGAVIYIADGATLSDPRLIRHAVMTAERLGIPYQFRQPGGGNTDAGAIHKSRAGVPSLTISIPIRNIHTPISIARIDDFLNTIRLVEEMLASLDISFLATERV
jgi:putative aminopeptidase FrvX